MTNTLTMTLHRERAVARAHRGGLVALPRRRDVAATSTRERRSLLTARRRVAVAGAAAGAVLYSNWLLEIVFTRRLPNPHEWISELATFDEPRGQWFRCGDRATAIICLIAAAAAPGRRPRQPLEPDRVVDGRCLRGGHRAGQHGLEHGVRSVFECRMRSPRSVRARFR